MHGYRNCIRAFFDFINFYKINIVDSISLVYYT